LTVGDRRHPRAVIASLAVVPDLDLDGRAFAQRLANRERTTRVEEDLPRPSSRRSIGEPSSKTRDTTPKGDRHALAFADCNIAPAKEIAGRGRWNPRAWPAAVAVITITHNLIRRVS
jgi:hypothetical protein